MISRHHVGHIGGKLHPRHDARTLQLRDYLTVDLHIPPACDWTVNVPAWGMLGNDKWPNCTVAGAMHMIMAWGAANGVHITFTEAQAIAEYCRLTGNDPAHPELAGGAIMLDILKAWRSTGIAGHKISAFVAIDYRNPAHVAAATYLFGGVYVGLALPRFAMDHPWLLSGTTGDAKPGSAGGHCVAGLRRRTGGNGLVSWGRDEDTSDEFFGAYCDEAYAVLGDDFIIGDRAPNGLDVATLKADLARVTA